MIVVGKKTNDFDWNCRDLKQIQGIFYTFLLEIQMLIIKRKFFHYVKKKLKKEEELPL